MSVLCLTESELRRCVRVDLEAIAVVEQGFSRLAAGEATVPPVLLIEIPERHGDIDVKTAVVRGMDHLALKAASCFPQNSQYSLPTSSGMMVLFSSITGIAEAVLLDNGYLTDVRTGAAGAAAAKYLAKAETRVAGVIGAGAQARYQIRALAQVRSFQKLLVYSRTRAAADRYAQEMARELDVQVRVMPDAESVFRQADVVVTTTASRQPFVRAEWLHPGLHITAMGSDTPDKQELDPEVLGRADRIVCDLRSQCVRLGELHHAIAAGVLTEAHPVTELGELTSGRANGRQSDDEITVADLTGVGVQDTVIAVLAYERALQMGLGTRIGDSEAAH